MLAKLKALELHYEEVHSQLADPAVYADREKLRALSREEKELSPLIEAWRALQERRRDLEAARELSAEPDFQESAREEIAAALSDLERLREEIRLLLLPRDPNDARNVVMEIRAGAGGEEAALFAHSLLRMYTMYAEAKGFRVEVVNCSETELGGVKEVQFLVEGEGAYSRLKFESGVHRVQGCRRRSPRAAFKPARSPWRCCPRPKRCRCASIRTICRSTPSVPPAQGGSM